MLAELLIDKLYPVICDGIERDVRDPVLLVLCFGIDGNGILMSEYEAALYECGEPPLNIVGNCHVGYRKLRVALLHGVQEGAYGVHLAGPQHGNRIDDIAITYNADRIRSEPVELYVAVKVHKVLLKGVNDFIRVLEHPPAAVDV